MKNKSNWEVWSKNFYNAKRFFESEGNGITISRYKDIWFKEFEEGINKARQEGIEEAVEVLKKELKEFWKLNGKGTDGLFWINNLELEMEVYPDLDALKKKEGK